MTHKSGQYPAGLFLAASLALLALIPPAAHAAKPWSYTGRATLVRPTTARLNGVAVANQEPTRAWFELGTPEAYSQTTSPESIGDGPGLVHFAADISGLTNGGAYCARLVVSNASGITLGAPRVFTTGMKVIPWGTDYFGNGVGELNVPVDLTNAVSITCGADHTIAQRNDGTLVAWGHPQGGVPANLPPPIQVSSAGYHTLALNADGTVAAWGWEGYGQSTLPPGLTNVVSVADAPNYSLALKADGTVVSWGSETNVPGDLTNVVEIAAGAASLALKADGTIVSFAGLAAPEGLSNAVALSCGGNFCLVLKADGTVVGRGIEIPPGLQDVRTIGAANRVGFAIRSDGTLIAFGDNSFGQTNPPLLANVTAAAGGMGLAMAIGNHRPVCASQVVNGPANGDSVIALGASDLDGEMLTLSIVSLPQSGTLHQFNNGIRGTQISQAGTIVTDPLGRVIFVPDPDAFGSPYDQFAFQAEDIRATSAPVSVTVNIIAGPYAFTQASTGVRTNSGTLNGMASANGFPALAWFEWGPRGSFTHGTEPVAITNSTPIHAAAEIGGLAARSIYQCRLIVSNAYGVAQGAVHWFTTGQGVGSWGNNDYGKANAPSGLHDVVAVANGSDTSLALRADGTLQGWGSTNYGTLYEPPAGLDEVIAISSGSARFLALKEDGTLEAWGSKAFGDPTPPAGLSNAVAVSSGYYHHLALQRDGRLAAWGGNERGQLNVPAGLERAVAVAGGGGHSLAVEPDGTVVGWGWNNYGQASVPPNLSNVVAVACGYWHSVALKSDGTVTAWGYSNFGTIAVPAGLSNVIAITACDKQTVALKSDGTLVGWGYGYPALPLNFTNLVAIASGNGYCTALGNHVPAASPLVASGAANTPMLVKLPATDFDGHLLQLRITSLPESGTLYQHVGGSPGDAIDAPGTTVTDPNGRVLFMPQPTGFGRPYATFGFVADDGELTSAPVTVTLNVLGKPGAFTHAPTAVRANEARLTGLVAPNGFPTLAWFEYGKRGAFTYSTPKMDMGAGAAVVHLSAPVTGLTNGSFHECRLVASNAAGVVAGMTRLFATGRKPILYWNSSQSPVPVNLTDAVALGCGSNHTVALKTDGTVVAWGRSSFGETNVPPGLADVVLVRAGATHNLVLQRNGAVVGWGDNGYGQVTIPAGLSNVVDLAGGYGHSLALLADGTVSAWGMNSNGQTEVPAGLSNVVSIAAGAECSLAARADGTVVAWGRNNHGQCNVPATLTNAVAVAAGYAAGLALRDDGRVIAWGDSVSYSLTNLSANLTNVCEIAAGERYGAALRPDGTVVLWGYPVPSVPQGMANGACLGAGANHCVSLGNLTPLASSLNSTTYVNSDLVIKLPAVDPDGDALTYRIISQPGAGTLYQYVNGNRGAAVGGTNAALSDPLGNVIFAPAPGALGTPYTSFTFLAHDEGLSSPTRTVTISSTFPLPPSISGQKSGWSKLSAPTLQHARIQGGGAFAFDFGGYTNINYQVWASTNLIDWEPLGEASVSGGRSFHFVDAEATKWSRRFYRATTPVKGGFLVQFSGSTNATYSVWGSTNLVAWDRIGTATAVSNGWYEFFDGEAISFGNRFYRVGAP